jgi:GNAT superfamily N-acetyltransferase
MRLKITRGTRADYRLLSGLHYRAGEPAVIDRVLCARHKGELVGVLVVARGVLNAPWRAAAWPGRFDQRCPRARARAVNHPRSGVRCLARVIVDPRVRGMGVASRLVRAYLRRPLTRCTEALAAMGRATPLFTRAGMREVENLSVSTRHARLARALRRWRIAPERLACPTRLMGRLDASRRRGVLAALRAWARGSKSTARRAKGPTGVLCAMAAGALSGPPRVFVFEQAGGRTWASRRSRGRGGRRGVGRAR